MTTGAVLSQIQADVWVLTAVTRAVSGLGAAVGIAVVIVGFRRRQAAH